MVGEGWWGWQWVLQERDLLGLAQHVQEQTCMTLHVMFGSHITILHTIFGGVCFKYTYDYSYHAHEKHTPEKYDGQPVLHFFALPWCRERIISSFLKEENIRTSWASTQIYYWNFDVLEAHCYVVDVGRTDREQICSRINNNWCRTFRTFVNCVHS